MKKMRLVLFLIVLLVPMFVFAENEHPEPVAKTVKYFKTVTILSDSEVMRSSNLGEVSSITTEITEEEYNSVDINASTTLNPRGLISETIETTYKMLSTTMEEYSSHFTYVTTLDWKRIPSTRSYDIMGIGFLGDVEAYGILYFEQYYCRNSTDCYYTNGHYYNTFDNGVGVSFKIPSGTVISLRQRLEQDVMKRYPENPITYQLAVGDYSHATSSISEANSHKFSVDCSGIVLNSSIENYYDTITHADAEWTGSW